MNYFVLFKGKGRKMFGYVKIDKPEMKVKEYEAYRGLYCSLCKAIGKHFGVLSRLILSYDITFIVLLRLSCLKQIPDFKQGRCPFNPAKSCNYCTNGDSELLYAAAVSVMMFYFKVKDDIADGSLSRRMLMYLIYPYVVLKYKKAKKLFPEIALMIDEGMARQREKEQKGVSSVDEAAHETADLLGRIMAYKLCDESRNIYNAGYGVGKWVYLLDAADDLHKDIKKNNYNVFKLKYDISDYSKVDEAVKKEIEYTLNMCCGFACRAYEKIESKTLVPIIENIIYEGMNKVMINVLKGKKNDERSL